MSTHVRTPPSPIEMDLGTYLSFIETRPKGEHWQLIDGVATLMPPPSLRHQVICGNLQRLLDAALDKSDEDFLVVQDAGLFVPRARSFRPECDVAVVYNENQESSWAKRFVLVAEVLSPGNTAAQIARKRRHYRTHPDNLYILVVRQDEVRVDLWDRASGWKQKRLIGPDAELSLPAFGISAPLSAAYRRTTLS